MSNKKAKERLIKIYGEECFIEKLHLRKDKEPRKYTGKKQMRRMKQLSYHHIKPRSKGGRTTIENGALLSVENHEWLHRQCPEVQRKLNKKFQEYKKCKVVTDDIDIECELHCGFLENGEIIEGKKLTKHEIQQRERRKEKKEFERERSKWEDR